MKERWNVKPQSIKKIKAKQVWEKLAEYLHFSSTTTELQRFLKHNWKPQSRDESLGLSPSFYSYRITGLKKLSNFPRFCDTAIDIKFPDLVCTISITKLPPFYPPPHMEVVIFQNYMQRANRDLKWFKAGYTRPVRLLGRGEFGANLTGKASQEENSRKSHFPLFKRTEEHENRS